MARSAPLHGSRKYLGLVTWLPVLLGFMAMFAPSYWAAAKGLWQTDEMGHAPIVFVVAVWLFWQSREKIRSATGEPAPALGWALCCIGVLLYCFGRALSISSVEFFAQPLLVAAILVLMKGLAALRSAWFAVFYLLFMVPLPGTLVDAVTGPLKHWISLIVVDVLFAAGYPISRTGVVIIVGQYQLLVADACSGLNSMVSLSALGALFAYLMGRDSRLHNSILIAAILPIAFGANILRVISLVLVTYHFGDDAGQGFLHGAAGLVLLIGSCALLFAFNAFLGLTLASTQSRAGVANR